VYPLACRALTSDDLTRQLGDPKFQTRIQDLFRGKMRYVVAASKLFHVLVVHGLPLKNAKARVEALKAMTTIVKQIGTETTLTKESVAAVIRCLQDSDGKIRNGALDVLGCVSLPLPPCHLP
jgi:hypothetical protein